jgi:CRP-like cAMP-binding protein
MEHAVKPPPTNPLALYLAKLERRSPLSEESREALLGLPSRLRPLEAYRDIIREGDRPAHCCLVVNGLVSRYKTLRNGSRQILSFHFAGDMVDLQGALVVIADHGVRAHIPSEIALIEHAEILELAARLPEVGRALWFDTLIDAAVFREWMVNVGRRTALQRTAHLLLELHYRMSEIGATDGDSFSLPVSQADLSDALGISPVHLNRTLQWLRAERLIRSISRTVIIEDPVRLTEIAGFQPNYLHPEGPRAP